MVQKDSRRLRFFREQASHLRKLLKRLHQERMAAIQAGTLRAHTAWDCRPKSRFGYLPSFNCSAR
jgi:hypothetical protein